MFLAWKLGGGKCSNNSDRPEPPRDPKNLYPPSVSLDHLLHGKHEKTQLPHGKNLSFSSSPTSIHKHRPPSHKAENARKCVASSCKWRNRTTNMLRMPELDRVTIGATDGACEGGGIRVKQDDHQSWNYEKYFFCKKMCLFIEFDPPKCLAELQK